MDYIKQHYFTEENIGLYYLSPYVTVRKHQPDSLCLIREDRQTELLLPDEKQQVLGLLEQLVNGICETDLSDCLLDSLNAEPQDWIAACLQGGIIE